MDTSSSQSWEEVAQFAADLCQSKSLNLVALGVSAVAARMWTPLAATARVKLLAKMEAAGISRWHPDPLRALEEVTGGAKPLP